MRDRHDYAGIERLGRHAVEVCALNDWESLIIEAYLMTGRTAEAQKLYDKTLEHYQKELGIGLLPDQLSNIEHLFNQATRDHSVIENIFEDLKDDAEQGEGGYYCSYPVFRGICRMLTRSKPECCRSSWLMMCTRTGEKDVKAAGTRAGTEISEPLKEAISRATDREDLFCRFGKQQYLLLLRDKTEATCKAIGIHIERNFALARRDHSEVTCKALPFTADGIESPGPDKGGEV
jgi:hypothetical protein